jgi:hypothetical protein
MNAQEANSEELPVWDTPRHIAERAMKKTRVARRSTKLEVR